MKANEIVWKSLCNRYFSANAKSGQYKQSMKWGSVFPTTKAQAKYFIEERVQMDVLNNKDVERIEYLLNKHGYTGEYRFTKSRGWVRLENYEDLYSALKKEYNI